MTDVFSKQKRKAIMSAIRSKNTKPEIIVRKQLYQLGFRYRLNAKDVLGKPDIVNRKKKIAIFVHGCYWHRHDCKRGQSIPDSNRKFWVNKFDKNVKRDNVVLNELSENGWHVLVVWE